LVATEGADMTIADAGSLLVAGLLGVIIGLAFFGSLHWVVRRLSTVGTPAFWVVGSAAVRIGLVVVAFLLIGQGRWQRIVAALAGFVVGRSIALRLWSGEQR
jgi:F1F0 ATPase subunit 2